MHPPRTLSRLLAAAGATIALFSGAVALAGDPIASSRSEVRADLAASRAAGRMDANGEAGATEAVLAARDRYNVELHAIADRRALEQQMAAAEAAAWPDLVSYVEDGAEGPVLVLLIFDADGTLHSADTFSIASID